MPLKHLVALFIALVYGCPALQAQLSGRVTDVDTKEPLAFVAIVEKGTTNGCYTDIDGYYHFQPANTTTVFVFSYVGYQEIERGIYGNGNDTLNIAMRKNANTTAEVIILPGINPAERIIKAAINNKKQNDPESDIAFTYDSYNKLVFGTKLDSVLLNNPDSLALQDTSTIAMYDFFNKQYLFLMESIATRKYLPPNHSEETIIANRVSGLKNTDFFLLATQLQSFSFYGETVQILGTSYMSPLADGAIKKYLFILEDTTFIDNDTVFTISFRPRKNKNFDGLKGQLFINSNKYALQNVIAEPNETKSLYIHIQQQYELVDQRKWFPMQLNSFFTFPRALINDQPMTGEGKSYIKNLKLDPPLTRKEFTPVTLLMGKNAGNQPDSIWNKYRDRPLDTKETTTYHTVDSIGKAENIDAQIKLLESLTTGLIPMGPVSFELARLLRFNNYEGYRLGAGLRTNNRLSETFDIGAYYAYGFKDKHSKYGGDIKLHLYKKRNAWTKLLYENDVMETAGNQFTKPTDGFLSQSIYPFFVSRMDRREKLEAQINGRLMGNLSALAFANTQMVKSFDHYQHNFTTEENVKLFTSNFNITEIGLILRYAPGEKLVRTTNKEIRLGGFYPLFWFRVTKGIDNIFGSTLDYVRLDASVEKTFRILNVGDFSINAIAGLVPQDVPLPLLYNAKGTNTLDYNKKWIGITVPNTFETMRINEFNHSQFIAVHLRHNFKQLLIKRKNFNPNFVLVSSMLWGKMNNTASHNIVGKAATKGYYESGLQINNLLKVNFTSLGVGVFYRYGPEHLSGTINNFAFKISSTLNF